LSLLQTHLRPYVRGDDVRSIDWNVTARMGHPFIKRYIEERELTVLLAVDVSGSNQFGSGLQQKREVAAELAAVLAFSAVSNNDRVGLVQFSDRVERFVPPRKGTRHVLRVIREVLSLKPAGHGTITCQAMRTGASGGHSSRGTWSKPSTSASRSLEARNDRPPGMRTPPCVSRRSSSTTPPTSKGAARAVSKWASIAPSFHGCA
jgi:uncharacterized protein (DUF58 family)